MAAVSAEGSTVWVLIRRLNSSWSRSIALVVRALFHWLKGNRVKVNSRSPASSRLSTGRYRASAYGFLMRSIDRHLDIDRQRQAAMDLAQRRQLLGELR